MKFRYRRYKARSSSALRGAIVARPEIPVIVIGPSGNRSLLALVDTGADLTMLPRSVAGLVGAPVDDTIRWPVGGFAGEVVEASPGDVELEISDGLSFHRWRATVAFVDYPAGAEESTILGHAGFLDFFRVLFDGPAGELEILSTPAFGGTSG